MSARAAPILRLKVPCPDLYTYRERHEAEFARKGIFIPSSRAQARPVGTRVHLKIELGDRTLGYSGGAIVVESVVDGARPGFLLHFEEVEIAVEPEPAASDGESLPPQARRDGPARARPPLGALLFDEPERPEAAPTAAPAPVRPGPAMVQVPRRTPPPAPPPVLERRPPRPGGPAAARALAPDLRAVTPAAPVALRAVTPPPTSTPPPAPPPVSAPRALAPEATLPASAATRAPSEAPALAVRFARPGDTDGAPLPLRSSLRTRLARHRLAVGAAVAVAVAAAIAGASSLARRRGDATESSFAVAISRADDRVRAGRLATPAGDSAVDHIEAARRLLPGDPRLASRGRLLADTLEDLGRRAVSRGDLEEAAAHLRGALRADPARASARAELETVASSQARRSGSVQ